MRNNSVKLFDSAHYYSMKIGNHGRKFNETDTENM